MHFGGSGDKLAEGRDFWRHVVFADQPVGLSANPVEHGVVEMQNRDGIAKLKHDSTGWD
jgi:hypothetical protein